MAARKPINIGDGAGLAFTLSAGGTAAWILRYYLGGKQRALTIGRYPDITIKLARELASKARAQVSQGIDPGREKQQNKVNTAAADSFETLTASYMEKKFPGLAPRTQTQRKQHINALILPKLGKRPAKQIAPQDIVQFLETAGKTKTTNVMELVFTAISEIFKHGVARRFVDLNPCLGLSVAAICGAAPQARLRLHLSEDQLRLILPELPSMGMENALMFNILIRTGVRIGELVKAQWKNLDFDRAEWEIPDNNSKTGSGYVVPLTPKLVEHFQALRPLSAGSAYVFPARQTRRNQNHGGDTYCEQRTLNKHIHELCDRLKIDEAEHFTPHDLRSTVSSYLAKLGVSLIIAERCLNHRIGGIAGIYNLHDYMAERREALETLESFLATCEAGNKWEWTTSQRTGVALNQVKPSAIQN